LLTACLPLPMAAAVACANAPHRQLTTVRNLSSTDGALGRVALSFRL
jgi:hypothetical protein